MEIEQKKEEKQKTNIKKSIKRLKTLATYEIAQEMEPEKDLEFEEYNK
jgi:hypothetical protein